MSDSGDGEFWLLSSPEPGDNCATFGQVDREIFNSFGDWDSPPTRVRTDLPTTSIDFQEDHEHSEDWLLREEAGDDIYDTLGLVLLTETDHSPTRRSVFHHRVDVDERRHYDSPYSEECQPSSPGGGGSGGSLFTSCPPLIRNLGQQMMDIDDHDHRSCVDMNNSCDQDEYTQFEHSGVPNPNGAQEMELDDHPSWRRSDMNVDHREEVPFGHSSHEEEMDVDSWTNAGMSPHDQIFRSSSRRNSYGESAHSAPYFPLPRPDEPPYNHDAFSELNHRLNEQKEAFLSLQLSIDQRITALMGHLEHFVNSQRSSARPTPNGMTTGKDSSANYFRQISTDIHNEACIRAHVKLRLGLCATQQLPDRPPQNIIARELSRINSGEEPLAPFCADLGDSLSGDWNRCVQKYFYHDFWAAVSAHIYQDTLIPDRFRDEKAFGTAYIIHMQHLKKTWQEQQQPPDPIKEESKRMHSSRNSRIGTTYRNRRDAAAILPASVAGPLVRLVEDVGTAGISSDEEMPGVRPRQYRIFEKPWRSDALCHLYRHLDLIHAANRNPNGNPIRTRHRTMRTRGSAKPPKGLPKDCLNSRYLDQITILEREFLQMTHACGIERMLTEVQRLG
ncbi:hypothetical protein Hypma_005819 [Hypsizygus marmoreus]|uniref:Uncharacterized protein n=1 Tax=Hypsizygus marmoreus TaxID=39966 RepID=A0A369K822_HYPMA|nr:hypothetical protein Hypma_005819 [Hypsizygus marmoreus]